MNVINIKEAFGIRIPLGEDLLEVSPGCVTSSQGSSDIFDLSQVNFTLKSLSVLHTNQLRFLFSFSMEILFSLQEML
jgi:hypothetical protein